MAKEYNCEINGIKYYKVTRTIGHKANGKPIKKQFYGDGKKDANKQADEYLEKLKKGVITNKNKCYTINILLPEWLFNVKIHQIKNTSFESYEGTYRNHVEPYEIANQNIDDLKSIMIQNFYNKLFEDGQTESNILKVHKLLNPFFKYCEKEGYVEKNPCANTTIPKDKDIDVDEIIEKQKVPFKYFTIEELKILRKEFEGNKYEKVVDFALGTGMRSGEIIGLKWVSINFEEREIYVKNNTTRSAVFNNKREKTGYKTKDGTPKTESSIDIIPMSDYIYDLLMSLPHDSEYVFTANGHQIDKKDLEKVWRKTLQSLIEKLKEKNIQFEYRVFHDLRHTFAVLLLLKGTDLYTIMKLMRHKKLSSTEIYLAVLPESKQSSVNTLNSVFD